MKALKAQISAEYVAVTGFLLIIAAVLFGFALLSFNENSKFVQADEAVAKIAGNANLVASLGEGSKVYFEIDIPEGVQSLGLSNKSVNMRLATSAGTSDVYAYTKASLTPVSISATRGRKSLSAGFVDGNVAVSLSG